jgi:hypothetical protein
LLELEVAGVACLVELTTGETLTGCLLVGDDHVAVRAGNQESYVPLGAVAWLRALAD